MRRKRNCRFERLRDVVLCVCCHRRRRRSRRHIEYISICTNVFFTAFEIKGLLDGEQLNPQL